MGSRRSFREWGVWCFYSLPIVETVPLFLLATFPSPAPSLFPASCGRNKIEAVSQTGRTFGLGKLRGRRVSWDEMNVTRVLAGC